MTMPVQQPGQGMMNFVGQQHSAPNAANVQMRMQQPAQQAMPMMAPYYAPNQQPYYAPNQQQPGYFWQVGAGNDKLNNSIHTTRCPTPTHNYALTASFSEVSWQHQPDKKDLNNMAEYFVGVVKLALYWYRYGASLGGSKNS
jgi:hypothetical protein